MASWRAILDEISAFLLTARCPGCDVPGTLLCERCADALRVPVVHTTTPNGMPVIAALPFDGVAARCIRRLKENGDTLLARPLGASLATVIERDAIALSGALTVPMPTTHGAFRRRGYRVPDLLLHRAGLRPVRLLHHTRRTADQRGLDLDRRRVNVAGSMRARHARVAGEVVLFDDVVTTGATLDEGARALTEAGWRVRGALTLAATPRRAPRIADAS
ncbi:ComF family protein [Microbacterium paludicola]|uniref:ComF family protein n=1 Tax=Microbacterium paludicola TaxID=300019 RepID=UPI0011A12F30|nr:ComF family protein [Microbacterium paludicola]